MSLGPDAGQVVVAEEHWEIAEVLTRPNLTDDHLLVRADVLANAPVIRQSEMLITKVITISKLLFYYVVSYTVNNLA